MRRLFRRGRSRAAAQPGLEQHAHGKLERDTLLAQSGGRGVRAVRGGEVDGQVDLGGNREVGSSMHRDSVAERPPPAASGINLAWYYTV